MAGRIRPEGVDRHRRGINKRARKESGELRRVVEGVPKVVPKHERRQGMNAHVSSILLGVRDMDRSKRFYTEGLGWKVQHDYGISVFFVQHGGSLVGFYGRDG